MRFSRALERALSETGADNWKSRLDVLRAERGTWKAVAEQLGVDKRTVERWRFGYADKRTHEHRQISDKTVSGSVVPKVRAAWKADRKAQVRAVNWRDLRVVGLVQVGDYEREAHVENMSAGAYMSAGAIAALAGAYLAGDDDALDDAMDQFLSDEYTQTAEARLIDVEKLGF